MLLLMTTQTTVPQIAIVINAVVLQIDPQIAWILAFIYESQSCIVF